MIVHLKLTNSIAHETFFVTTIDLLAILHKSLDQALFYISFYTFLKHKILSSGVRVSITIVHIRKFSKM